MWHPLGGSCLVIAQRADRLGTARLRRRAPSRRDQRGGTAVCRCRCSDTYSSDEGIYRRECGSRVSAASEIPRGRPVLFGQLRCTVRDRHTVTIHVQAYRNHPCQRQVVLTSAPIRRAARGNRPAARRNNYVPPPTAKLPMVPALSSSGVGPSAAHAQTYRLYERTLCLMPHLQQRQLADPRPEVARYATELPQWIPARGALAIQPSDWQRSPPSTTAAPARSEWTATS
jgi:hypothetical protein